ncbi:hypothetical protein NPIL_625881 [Nephila pilipes]|uniref:Uncharacterized protein n=1 Tax=Nephila pilipes TaxID=299642 RepID=A0A8X6NUE4_NEPPI|nr:hypothetical protein NPIL_625881 [Nephila pilipes]
MSYIERYQMIVHRLFCLQQNWDFTSFFGRGVRLFLSLFNGPQMSRLLRHTDAPTSVTTCARVERRFPWSNFKPSNVLPSSFKAGEDI